MEQTETMAGHFIQGLQLPPDAAGWLLGLWHTIQALDDFADGDKVERRELDILIWNMLVAMPQNPFFRTHADTLLPLIAVAILKWQASDKAERMGKADAKSYMWRAGYYDIVLAVVMLVHGHGIAMESALATLSLYGEEFDKYMEEWKNA